MRYALLAVAAFQIFSALTVIYQAGRPVKPIGRATAVTVMIIAGVIAGICIVAGIRS